MKINIKFYIQTKRLVCIPMTKKKTTHEREASELE